MFALFALLRFESVLRFQAFLPHLRQYRALLHAALISGTRADRSCTRRLPASAARTDIGGQRLRFLNGDVGVRRQIRSDRWRHRLAPAPCSTSDKERRSDGPCALRSRSGRMRLVTSTRASISARAVRMVAQPPFFRPRSGPTPARPRRTSRAAVPKARIATAHAAGRVVLGQSIGGHTYGKRGSS